MRPSPRRGRGLTLAGLGLLVLVSTVPAAAATLGGSTADSLSSARASTQRLTGVQLDWAPVFAGLDWRVDGLTVTADPGQTFLAGDVLKVTLGRSGDSACEVTKNLSEDATTVSLDAPLQEACQWIGFDEIDRVAVVVTGDDLAASFTSGLGEIRGTLSSFDGAVVNPNRTLRAGVETGLESSPYVGDIEVDVTEDGLTAASLAGTRVSALLQNPDTQATFEYSGVISLDESDPIRVAPNGGSTVQTITVDLAALASRAGTPRVKTAEVSRFTVILSSPQHLGAAYDGAVGAYAVSVVDGTIDADSPPDSTAGTALDPIGLDRRLSYQYPPATNFDSSTLSFCHSFTISNTSDEPVDWTLTFNTSYRPLWGLDPTASGVFSSAWNWETVSYDPATHLWTIRGVGWNRTLQPGQTLSGMGYCVQNVPVPPVDPAAFTHAVSVNPSSGAYWTSLSLTVASTSSWNLPWEVTLDLADYVCAAGLEGRPLQWHGDLVVTPVQGTVYRLRGRTGSYARFVASGRPLTIDSLLGYAPANGSFALPCSTESVPAAEVAMPGEPGESDGLGDSGSSSMEDSRVTEPDQVAVPASTTGSGEPQDPDALASDEAQSADPVSEDDQQAEPAADEAIDPEAVTR